MLSQLSDTITMKQNDSLSYSNLYYDYSDNNAQNEKNRQSENGKYVSESDYWEYYYEDPDFNYEWNNGILEEKEMPTSFSDLIKQWFEIVIYYYLINNPIARQIKSELAFKIILSDKTSIRKPDFSLILKSNPDQLELFDRSYHGTYDLCVEYLSDSKAEYVNRDTVDKKKEYCGGKVNEYYIIDAEKKHTVFYRLVNNKKENSCYYRKIRPQNGIIKSKILPGFQFRLKDLYLLPNPEELYKDDVYKSFVKVDYQNVLKVKEEAIQNAELEKKAKEEAIQNAELERKAKEFERKAKEEAIQIAELERKAKEEERKAKEEAIQNAELERKAKENALKEIECLKQML